jgi:inorganic pyrophosphatase
MAIMNLWKELPPGPDPPRVLYVVIEIPKRSRNKYEYDTDGGFIKLDRVLYSSLHYPGDYGFIPRTLHEDGDPLDALVITNEATFSGCVIEARPLGVFHLIDKGQPDDKILAVPATDPFFNHLHTLSDVSQHFLDEVQHFFSVYKDLEQATVECHGWEDREKAFKEIHHGMGLYDKHIK